jgi:hypothetical protein
MESEVAMQAAQRWLACMQALTSSQLSKAFDSMLWHL